MLNRGKIRINIILEDVCTPNPCMNGGMCMPNGFGGFSCQCQAGFSGQTCTDRKILNLIFFLERMFNVFLLHQVNLVLLNLA